MPIKVGDRLPEYQIPRHDGGRPGVENHRRNLQGQEGRAIRRARRLHRRPATSSICPAIVQNADAIKAKGVDTIAVTGVNDIFVMDAWKKASGADKIEFLADGNGEFAKAIDLTLRRLRQRARHALEALLHAGRRRRGEEAQRRGSARQVRGLRRRRDAQGSFR